MTGPRNPLGSPGGSFGSRPAFIERNGEQVPTDIDGYCNWLNRNEKRRGAWVVESIEGKRTVIWHEQTGSADWLRERGLLPNIGKAA